MIETYKAVWKLSMRTLLMIACCLCLSFSGCGSSNKENRVETLGISGTVMVDGKPASLLKIIFHPESEIAGHPAEMAAFTDDQGKFVASTYEQTDGLPKGKYKLCFYWGEMNMLNMQYGGDDKLGEKYLDPANSEFTVEINGEEPIEMGQIDLKSK